MRIALVVPSLAAGGAERVASTLANDWAAAGHAVCVLTVSGPEGDFYALRPDVSRAALALMRAAPNALASAVLTVRRVRAIRAALAAHRPDVVVSFVDRTNVLVLAATLGTRAPVVVAERTDPRAYRLGGVWSALRRLTYRRAAALVVQTPEVRTWASQELPGLPVAVIPNPIDPAQWPAGPPAERRRPVVAALGRLRPEKGFDLLLRAFAAVAHDFPDWQLRVLGEGPEGPALERLTAELAMAARVTFAGETRDPGSELRAAAIFALPSRFEGFPNALLEAMASGCAVIAFDCPSGPRHVVRDGRDGLLVAAEDVNALAEGLRRLMGDRALRARLSTSASAVADRFGLHPVSEQWQAVLAAASAARRGRRASGSARGEGLEVGAA